MPSLKIHLTPYNSKAQQDKEEEALKNKQEEQNKNLQNQASEEVNGQQHDVKYTILLFLIKFLDEIAFSSFLFSLKEDMDYDTLYHRKIKPVFEM